MRQGEAIGIVMAVLVGAVVLAPAGAEAKRNVVVERVDFVNDAVARKIGEHVKNVVADTYWLVDESLLAARLEGQSAMVASPARLRDAARVIGADVIISSKLSHRGESWLLTGRVIEGDSGRAISQFRIELAGPRLTSAARKRLVRELQVIERAQFVGSQPEDEAPPVNAALPASPAGDDARVRDAAGALASAEENASFALVPAADTAVAPAQIVYHASSARLPGRSAAVLELGMTVMKRDLSFDLDGAGSGRPATYDGAPAPSALVQGVLYPGQLLAPHRRALAGLGIGFSFERSLLLETSALVAGGARDFATTQRRYGADLRYRVLVGQRDSSVVASVGAGRMGTLIDEGDMELAVPDVDYGFVRVGAEGRLHASRLTAFTLAAHYLHVLDAGELESPGAYGEASVRGVELESSIVYAPTRWLSLRAGARYTRMDLSLEGTGTRALIGSGDDQVQVTGASDEIFGGFVTASTSL